LTLPTPPPPPPSNEEKRFGGFFPSALVDFFALSAAGPTRLRTVSAAGGRAATGARDSRTQQGTACSLKDFRFGAREGSGRRARRRNRNSRGTEVVGGRKTGFEIFTSRWAGGEVLPAGNHCGIENSAEIGDCPGITAGFGTIEAIQSRTPTSSTYLCGAKIRIVGKRSRGPFLRSGNSCSTVEEGVMGRLLGCPRTDRRTGRIFRSGRYTGGKIGTTWRRLTELKARRGASAAFFKIKGFVNQARRALSVCERSRVCRTIMRSLRLSFRKLTIMVCATRGRFNSVIWMGPASYRFIPQHPEYGGAWRRFGTGTTRRARTDLGLLQAADWHVSGIVAANKGVK